MGRLSGPASRICSAVAPRLIQAPSEAAATWAKRDQISPVSAWAWARLWPQAARVAAS